MDRLQVIQSLMKYKRLRRYLEIGVFNGHLFFRIRSRFKTGVDPEFRFGRLRRMIKLLVNPYNRFNRYYAKTSDEFFAEDAPALFRQAAIDIALVDGMHEYAFALRDIEHTVKHLSANGVIVVHDCNPVSPEAAVSFAEWKQRGFKEAWNGDVWKAILHIRSQRADLSAFVLDADYGLGIIVKQPNPNLLSFTPEEIAQLNYQDLERHRQEWLGLQPPSYLSTFFNFPGSPASVGSSGVITIA